MVFELDLREERMLLTLFLLVLFLLLLSKIKCESPCTSTHACSLDNDCKINKRDTKICHTILFFLILPVLYKTSCKSSLIVLSDANDVPTKMKMKRMGFKATFVHM